MRFFKNSVPATALVLSGANTVFAKDSSHSSNSLLYIGLTVGAIAAGCCFLLCCIVCLSLSKSISYGYPIKPGSEKNDNKSSPQLTL